MSPFGRNFVPLGLAVVFGIANGYYAFQPLLKEQQEKLEVMSKNGQPTGTASGGSDSN
ncbi:hypothetical protein GGR50DRAFT_696436 [Xylaria sp. CBS 124048]|nr:hypothetical protein GGR50DRAFT_696436 [Xylaria sp. CBS 124048]